MRTYERLNAEVVKFEAQDVITASTAVSGGTTGGTTGGGTETSCTCNANCGRAGAYAGHGEYKWVDAWFWIPGHWELTKGCDAPEGKHDNCTSI